MGVHRGLFGKRTAGGLIAAALLVLVLPAAASAFPPPVSETEPFSLYSCDQCHATAGESSAWDGSGPHKHYSTTTAKCAVCHDVHQAPDAGVLLLRGATVSQTCLICHDGTGSGIGPYDSIEAHGGVVAGEHQIEITNVVPGGSSNLANTLSCGDCHAVHGTNTVAPFLRDTGRAYAADLYVSSDCLLRNDVWSGVPNSVPEYSSAWCAACHDQRHSNAPLVNNHPVNTDAAWGYGDIVSTVDTAVSWREALTGTTATGLGRTNSGYIMAPVAVAGDGRVDVRVDPICQQCHEDARDVEQVFSADYTFRGTDPWNSPTNPGFVTFPHQTTNANLLVEQWDDICLNCHSVAELP